LPALYWPNFKKDETGRHGTVPLRQGRPAQCPVSDWTSSAAAARLTSNEGCLSSDVALGRQVYLGVWARIRTLTLGKLDEMATVTASG
jgi:hypothetical protein